ncbi:MAG: hypothetical protein JWO04_5685 [Gammaproteobacteria bacterium]|jgi:hypothetical protein|nr:hypothetical protein [Gammaproteobacteria bacterium]
MAAKNKRTNRAATSEAGRTPGEHTTTDLHLRASHHREELLEEARALMAAGRVREARAVEKRAGQVEQLVGALESDIRSGLH